MAQAGPDDSKRDTIETRGNYDPETEEDKDEQDQPGSIKSIELKLPNDYKRRELNQLDETEFEKAMIEIESSFNVEDLRLYMDAFEYQKMDPKLTLLALKKRCGDSWLNDWTVSIAHYIAQGTNWTKSRTKMKPEGKDLIKKTSTKLALKKNPINSDDLTIARLISINPVKVGVMNARFGRSLPTYIKVNRLFAVPQIWAAIPVEYLAALEDPLIRYGIEFDKIVNKRPDYDMDAIIKACSYMKISLESNYWDQKRRLNYLNVGFVEANIFRKDEINNLTGAKIVATCFTNYGNPRKILDLDSIITGKQTFTKEDIADGLINLTEVEEMRLFGGERMRPRNMNRPGLNVLNNQLVGINRTQNQNQNQNINPINDPNQRVNPSGVSAQPNLDANDEDLFE